MTDIELCASIEARHKGHTRQLTRSSISFSKSSSCLLRAASKARYKSGNSAFHSSSAPSQWSWCAFCPVQKMQSVTNPFRWNGRRLLGVHSLAKTGDAQRMSPTRRVENSRLVFFKANRALFSYSKLKIMQAPDRLQRDPKARGGYHSWHTTKFRHLTHVHFEPSYARGP